MSHAEVITLLDTIASMTDAPDLDTAVATNWFKRCLEIHTMVVLAKAQEQYEMDRMVEAMAARHEEMLDAQADAVHAGWGWD